LSVAYGAIDAFTSPALRGVIPELVARDDTQRANSLLAAAQNGARILGPAAGGLFVVGVGGGWAIALDALSFIIAAAFFTRLPASPGQTGTAAPARRRGLLADIADGWREFRAIPWLVAMSVSFCFLNLVNVGPWQILGPDLARQHGSEAAWGVVLIAYDTTLQQHVPRHVLSRIAAIDDLPSYAAVAVGEVASGGCFSLGVTGGERALSEICESYSKATEGATDASVHRRRRGRRRTAPRPHADDGRP
jgi:MFS family permease